jgi:hypothetical protein
MPTNLRNYADSESAKISCAFAHYLVHAGFLLGFVSTMKMKTTCSPKCQLTFSELHGGYVPEDKTLRVFIFQYIGYPEDSFVNCLDRVVSQSHDLRCDNHMSKK